MTYRASNGGGGGGGGERGDGRYIQTHFNI